MKHLKHPPITFRSLQAVLLLLSAFVVAGCPSSGGDGSSGSASSDGSSSSSSSTTIVPLVFAGIASATSLNANSVLLTWVPNGNALGYEVFEIFGNQSYVIANLPSTASSYTAANLSANTIFTFLIRAEFPTGVDSNNVTLSAYTYSGITNITNITTTTAVVGFGQGGTSVTGYQISCSKRAAAYQVMAVPSSGASSVILTGLDSGTTYTCKANAYVPAVGGYDNNTATVSFQTTSLTSTAYKGVMLASAYSDVSSSSWTPPSNQPSARQVTITWPAFSAATASTQYALVRTGRGNPLDTTTSTACTATSTTSCFVCTKTGLGIQTCTDTAVAVSPQQYDYTIVKYTASGTPEETPSSGDTQYRTGVEIPPANMVLVQRDSVNYEMCVNVLQEAVDPFNHQRCLYTGFGGVPYNSNPGNPALSFSTTYYDFGYDLFVDRWNAACNWTAGPATCLNTNANGDCFRNTDPTAAPAVLASDKSVFYNTSTGACWIDIAGTWTVANALSSTSTPYLEQIYTNAPSSTVHKPPLVNVSQSQANTLCQAQVDPNYGPKRIPRHREFIALGAPPMTGEPNALTDTQIDALELGGIVSANIAPNYYCNGASAAGISAAIFNSTNYELATDIGAEIPSVTIGSTATSACVSRFGVQDYAGNVWQISSEQFSCSTTDHNCVNIATSIDSGNTDYDGVLFNGRVAPGGTLGGQAGPNYTTQWNDAVPAFDGGAIAAPLGLPLVSDGSTVNVSTLYGSPLFSNSQLIFASGVVANRLHNAGTTIFSDSGVTTRGLLNGGAYTNSANTLYGMGRFDFNMQNDPTSTAATQGFRCVVPTQ